MFSKFMLLVLSLFIVVSNGSLDTDLIMSFFEKKHLKHNLVLTCCSKKEQVKLLRNLTISRSFIISVKYIKYLNILKSVVANHKRVGIVLDGNCADAMGLLLRCKRYKVFDSKHHWLVLFNSSNYQYLFKYVDLNIDSDLKVAYPNGDENQLRANYIIDDVYNPANERGGTLQYSQVGYHDVNNKYHVNEAQNKYFTRRNLSGVQFKTIVVFPEPFEGTMQEYLVNDKNIEINTFNRFHSRLMHYCQEYYNFRKLGPITINLGMNMEAVLSSCKPTPLIKCLHGEGAFLLTTVPWLLKCFQQGTQRMDITLDKSWGYLQSDGTMDGLVGSLERRKIDFGLSPLFVKKDRAKFISYGRKTWNLRAAFILKNPKSRKSYQIFIKPLSFHVWICIMLSFTLSVLTQKIGYTMDEKLDEKYFNKGNVDSSWSFSSVCTFGAFCQQGIIAFPNSLSGRIAAYVTLLLGLLIYQFYSASLVSFLLNVPTTMINSVEGILNNGFKIGCEDVLYDKDFLKYATDNTTQEVYRRLLRVSSNYSGFLKPEVGLNLVKKGQYAFHVELVTGYPIIQRSFDESTICELKEVPMFQVKQMHANYQKFSPFKDLLDTCLHRFGENGVIAREILFWHPKKPECMRSSTTININTGLQDFYPALVVLSIGIFLSLFILIIEILWYHRNKYKSMDVKGIVFPYVN